MRGKPKGSNNKPSYWLIKMPSCCDAAGHVDSWNTYLLHTILSMYRHLEVCLPLQTARLVLPFHGSTMSGTKHESRYQRGVHPLLQHILTKLHGHSTHNASTPLHQAINQVRQGPPQKLHGIIRIRRHRAKLHLIYLPAEQVQAGIASNIQLPW